jgi:NADPH-dependent 2,4-dienoyl-CoA reductase/sulfur reductase-like enzyme
MQEEKYNYIVAGSGLTGASAVEGIRELDKGKPLLLIGEEKYLPYDRPPLTKKLWFGQQQVKDIFLHDQKFYDESGISLALGTCVVSIDTRRKIIVDDKEKEYAYVKLLLATGGTPRRLPIPGGELDGICYYRYLNDYLEIRRRADEGASAVVIGGGFIGSEIAAALTVNKLDVTMIFPEEYICSRVFPRSLGEAMQSRYLEREIRVLNNDKPVSFAKKGSRFVTRTQNGEEIESDIVIVGIGIAPDIKLAQNAGLNTSNGITVNEYLQTSDPDIYAAGDNAFFPYQALGQQMRIEHWDNALKQGKLAGRNMAGANEAFTYLPYFFSDLFEFGYEAVGEVDSRLQTFTDWQKENHTGVIYYLSDGKVRGVMMCNISKKLKTARELIRRNEKLNPDSLAGLIRQEGRA